MNETHTNNANICTPHTYKCHNADVSIMEQTNKYWLAYEKRSKKTANPTTISLVHNMDWKSSAPMWQRERARKCT